MTMYVRLSIESQRYFGVQFARYVMVFTVLPVGFRSSPYIYQTMGMVVTSVTVVTVQYIDDRLGVSGVKKLIQKQNVMVSGLCMFGGRY